MLFRSSTSPRPDERAHTVMDRTLLRAGETVSMKHILRSETEKWGKVVREAGIKLG